MGDNGEDTLLSKSRSPEMSRAGVGRAAAGERGPSGAGRVRNRVPRLATF
jgi:hypothetical protein